jgi:hypothetical protein
MNLDTLGREQVHAGARFLVEFQKYVPIQAAFWLIKGDETDYSLYIAS